MAGNGRSLRGAGLAVAFFFSVLFSTCTPGHGGAAEAPRPRLAREVVLRVTNRGWSDVVVYAVEGGRRIRLGRVAALQRADLLIPGATSLGRPVRLLVHAAGDARAYEPEPVWGRAGEVLELTVQPLLTTSQLIVR